MLKKPRVKVIPGENPNKIVSRYQAMHLFIRHRRRDFLVFFVLLMSLIMLFVKGASERDIPPLKDLPELFINVEKIECVRYLIPYYKAHETFFDLEIDSYGRPFFAYDLPVHLCKKLEKAIQPQSDIWITHNRGQIFQLRHNDAILLTQEQAAKGIKAEFNFRALQYDAIAFFFLMIMPIYWLFIAARAPEH